MTGEERAAKLRAAAGLIRAVAADLDHGVSECGHCRAIRFNHFGEMTAYRTISSLGRKVDGWARSLERGLNRERRERREDEEDDGE